jgi:hypothetical protein
MLENANQSFGECYNICYNANDSQHDSKILVLVNPELDSVQLNGYQKIVFYGSWISQYLNELLKLGVIIRPVGGFKPATWLRVSIGTMEENREFIKALKKVLA